MKQFVLNRYLCLLATGCMALSLGAQELWYERAADDNGLPATKKKKQGIVDPSWEAYALPLGNGRIGAMIYGGVEKERIQLNEKSLWSGGPNSKDWSANMNDMEAYKKLPELRQLTLDRKNKDVADLIKSGFTVPKNDAAFGAYMTYGELDILTDHQKDQITDYERRLDLEKALHSVHYKYKNTEFTRTAFISYPANVLVTRFTSTSKTPQNLCVELKSPHPVSYTFEDNLLKCSTCLPGNQLNVFSAIGFISDDNVELSFDENKVNIKNAKDISLVFSVGTDYRNEYPHYRGDAPAARVIRDVKGAVQKGYNTLLSEHIQDYQRLYNRVQFRLDGGVKERMPTDKRLETYREKPDQQLETLIYQYGRYLLISSSRAGSLPANLQGIWNEMVTPPWQCDYHYNINLQMNYWPSTVANLLECQQPLIDFIDSLRAPGALTAKGYFGADGWTVNHAGNVWGHTAPRGNVPRYSYFPLGGAWLTTHAWEHYCFEQDKAYLKNRLWPIMEGTGRFLADYLYRLPDGTYSSTPSTSPEHGEPSIGSTSDISMAREAIRGILGAADVLDIENEMTRKLTEIYPKLVPFKIGKYGQLQEWYDDLDDPKDKHRHVNHLFGLYPGHQINPYTTPDLAAAAKTTLEQRGDKATGWSMGWKINLWARLHDGDHTYLLVKNFFEKTSRNLLCLHPPFQIDGNLGYTAGVSEMLVQSTLTDSDANPTVFVLPALPSAWKKGEIKGLRIRGGGWFDVNWDNGKGKLRIYKAKFRKVNLVLPGSGQAKPMDVDGEVKLAFTY